MYYTLMYTASIYIFYVVFIWITKYLFFTELIVVKALTNFSLLSTAANRRLAQRSTLFTKDERERGMVDNALVYYAEG